MKIFFPLLTSFICNSLPVHCDGNMAVAETPPNLLIIITDQQRYDALSYAGNTVLHTPNMDRIAEEGVWFKNAYTQCAVCVPARASMLTGHNLENHLVINNDRAFETDVPGLMAMPTFDEVLAENNYSCEYYGKWHCPIDAARIYQNEVTTTKATELGRSMKSAYLDFLNPLFKKEALEEGEFYDTYTVRPYLATPIDERYIIASEGGDTSVKPGQSEVHGITRIPEEYHISAHESGLVLEALERLKDSTFSISCSFHHPHPPFVALEKYMNMFPPAKMIVPASIDDDMMNSPYKGVKEATEARYSDPEKVKYWISEYYALVKEIDDRIGAILNKLDDLGLTDNTLVIFMSDHGEMLGSHGMKSKNVFYEEASHIPLMMRFPGKIEAGTIVENPVSLTNIFATIFDYFEMPPLDSDGFSLRGLIEGRDEVNGKYAVTEWLSSLSSKPSHMVIKEGWKLMLPDSSATELMKALYNLNEDPLELNNLLGNNPDANIYEDKVAELEYCFIEWLMKSRRIELSSADIVPQAMNNEIRIYPNPSNSNLYIHIPNLVLPAIVQFIDLNGRTIQEEKLKSEYSSVSVSNLNTGIYLYKLKSAYNQSSTGRLVIQ
ncbi:MAG: sulfatase-like hydrolase/transferase [Bacteroidales bacterium]|nr:sulfatase-like hydrolase/transferase [Bacteroidales bacterium]MCF8389169.1 sulfatase-like hydrolase/transferase [Bacteroidales bacterium]